MCAKYNVYQKMYANTISYVFLSFDPNCFPLCFFFLLLLLLLLFFTYYFICLFSISIWAVETHFLTNMTNMLLLINKNTRFNVYICILDGFVLNNFFFFVSLSSSLSHVIKGTRTHAHPPRSNQFIRAH